jgi:D-arabinose 1-dehydrogenase-like Zn-dependent alcohol dehydrogenase
MLAFRTTTPAGPFETVRSVTPVPDGRQVLLSTVATGVCHSDVHLHDTHFDLGKGKTLPAGQPGMTLGHEIAGRVAAVGPAVSGIAVGEACVAYPWIGCGRCALCAAGDEQLCAAGAVLGIQQPGGFADHVLVADERYLFPIGDLAPTFACTLACSGLTAFSALRKIGRLRDDDSLVIVGAGGVGLNAVQMAKVLTGVQPVVVDLSREKLEAATAAGARHVLNATDADAAAGLRRLTGGGAAACIDFVGSEATSQLAQRNLRKGGKLVIVGLFGGTFSMPLPMIPLLAQTIQGSYVGRLDDMAELMSLARGGRIPPIPLQTREASADTVRLALDELRAGRVTGRTVLTF